MAIVATMSASSGAAIDRWASRGRLLRVNGPTLAPQDVFIVDVPARSVHPEEALETLVVVHGFPTSSFDWSHIVDAMARRRRVVLVDLPGYGFSDKPDTTYRIASSADAVMSVVDQLGIEEMALLSHDMGDTVVGELLARNLEGTWNVRITRRVVTNGSIYIAMAHLTDGQLMLLDLPDEAAPNGPGPELLSASLVATLAERHRDVDMSDHATIVCRSDGDRLLPRLIRYIEERRSNESRFTGAIETHPAPLGVLWGPEDPIAVAAMAERLVAERPDAELRWIAGSGHYPQIEDPEAYLGALEDLLG